MNEELLRFTHHVLRFVCFALSFNMSQFLNISLRLTVSPSVFLRAVAAAF